IQISNMIGNGPPLFTEKAGEDPSDWILEFKRFLVKQKPGMKTRSKVETGNVIIFLMFLGEALIVRNNAGGDITITGANIIPADTWDEDWSIAGGHPAPVGTPSPANYANAGAVEAQKNLLFFGQIMQRGMSILEYNAKISKLGKLAGLPESKMREQYIWGLNPMNQYNIRMMAKYHDTRDNITKALVEAEKFSLLQGNFPFPPSGGQPQEEQSNQIILSQNDFKKLIAGKQKADELAIDRFLDSIFDNTGLPGDDYDYDPVEDLRLQFEELDINQAKLARLIHAVLKSSQYRCSKCDETVLASKVKLIELNKKLQLHINKSEKVANGDILFGIQNTLEKAKID
ncbi:3770_t:CDS:2, partial [Acaulospora morrowiae]